MTRSSLRRWRPFKNQSTSNPTAFAQHGALAALTSDHAFRQHDWLATYDARRHRIVEGLNAIDGVTCALPGGAFYVFPDISALIGRRLGDVQVDSDLRFCELLLEHGLVIAVPGAPFGAPGFLR